MTLADSSSKMMVDFKQQPLTNCRRNQHFLLIYKIFHDLVAKVLTQYSISIPDHQGKSVVIQSECLTASQYHQCLEEFNCASYCKRLGHPTYHLIQTVKVLNLSNCFICPRSSQILQNCDSCVTVSYFPVLTCKLIQKCHLYLLRLAKGHIN